MCTSAPPHITNVMQTAMPLSVSHTLNHPQHRHLHKDHFDMHPPSEATESVDWLTDWLCILDKAKQNKTEQDKHFQNILRIKAPFTLRLSCKSTPKSHILFIHSSFRSQTLQQHQRHHHVGSPLSHHSCWSDFCCWLRGTAKHFTVPQQTCSIKERVFLKNYLCCKCRSSYEFLHCVFWGGLSCRLLAGICHKLCRGFCPHGMQGVSGGDLL